jgi:hypothetical protein
VRGTGGDGDIGMLRLDFPGYSGEDRLQEISWDDWFAKFEERGLALLYQDTTARGEKSNFNKIIARETAQARAQGQRKANRRTARAVSARGRAKTPARGRATAKRTAAARDRASSRRKTTARSARSTRTHRAAAQKKTSRTATGRARPRRKAA